jgi:hypothetical protein
VWHLRLVCLKRWKISVSRFIGGDFGIKKFFLRSYIIYYIQLLLLLFIEVAEFGIKSGPKIYLISIYFFLAEVKPLV